MRILYGVQGTGNGHITRARAMLPKLRAAGCTVDFVFSGRPDNSYFDMEIFGNWRALRGFTMSTVAGKIRWGETVGQVVHAGTFLRDVFRLNVKDYDLVLTDFEPVSAWAATLRRVPALGLAHQYALCYPLPGIKHPALLRLGLSLFAPARRKIGIHWQHFDAPILPPLISLNADTPAHYGESVLVYLPFEHHDSVARWLKTCPQQPFTVYAPHVRTVCRDGNLTVKPLSRTTFPADLAACAGIICNSGFGACSEAMVLGKKILTRPVEKQVEQQSNAAVLAQIGRAEIIRSFDSAQLAHWLQQPHPPRAVFPDTADALAAWIAGGMRTDFAGLKQKLWAQTRNLSPEHFSAA